MTASTVDFDSVLILVLIRELIRLTQPISLSLESTPVNPSFSTCFLGFNDENYCQLHVNSDMQVIVKALASSDSGLDVRDRMWLKITIPNAFIGRLIALHLDSGLEKKLDLG